MNVIARPATMPMPLRIAHVRSGLARPPVTLSLFTSLWNSCRRGDSGVAGVVVSVPSVVIAMDAPCWAWIAVGGCMGSVGGCAEVGRRELFGDLDGGTGANDVAVQHDRRDLRDAEHRLRELLDDQDREAGARELRDSFVQ